MSQSAGPEAALQMTPSRQARAALPVRACPAGQAGAQQLQAEWSLPWEGQTSRADHPQVRRLRRLARLEASAMVGLHRPWVAVRQEMCPQALSRLERMTDPTGIRFDSTRRAGSARWPPRRRRS